MKPTIFFAIPCGGFYDKHREIIDAVCKDANVIPNIVEDDDESKPLWLKISEGIEKADFFVADISSLRANIMLELGYALKSQPDDRSTFFISKNIEVPADLQWMTYHPYAGLRGFRKELTDWMVKVVQVDANCFRANQQEIFFEETFADRDRFLKWWNPPPGCQFNLTHEGLRFANAYYPILSTTLAVLEDYEFTFRARVEREAIGWVVKGTVNYQINSPIFGVMFQLFEDGMFRPHILCSSLTDDKKLNYHHSKDVPTGLNIGNKQEFMVTTKCIGDDYSIEVRDKSGKTWNWEKNLAQDETLGQYYKSVEKKQGQVGFRCAGWREGEWGEVATVNWLKVEEIDSSQTTGV